MRIIKNVLIFLIPLALLAAACTFFLFSKRIPKNPTGTIGNTAGNLNNGGLFCEDDGVVYFSNSYDNGCLYSMNADETDCKKISKAVVSSINAAGNYVYFYQIQSEAAGGFSYFRTNGIYRMKKNGKDSACLKRIPSPSFLLYNNTIFYQANPTDSGTVLWRIDIDKENPDEVADYLINPACVYRGIIYFGGTKNNHFLYSLDPQDNHISTVFQGDVYNPIVQDDYVYYMDISSDYRLCRYHMIDQSVEVLTEDRLDFYNVTGDMIYYQKSSPTEPALKRMRLDGSQNEIVAEGVYEHINATSRYVYFNLYDTPTPIYRTPVNGPVEIDTFLAAERAAIQEMD